MSAPVRMASKAEAGKTLLAYAVTGTLAAAASGVTIAASQHKPAQIIPEIITEAPAASDDHYRALIAGTASQPLVMDNLSIGQARAQKNASRTVERSATSIPPPHYKQHRTAARSNGAHYSANAVPPAHYRITHQQRAAETVATDALNRAELERLK